MRLTRTITKMNWRHAIGEVLLIVIGISIALGANSWYEDRKERAEERAVLRQIVESLNVDLQTFQDAQRNHLVQESDIIRLIEHMEGDAPYQADLGPLFRSLRRWIWIVTSTAPYEALKSRGFALIGDQDLRSKIIYYYENEVRSVLGAAENDRAFVVSQLAPFIDRNLHALNSLVFVPLDYEVLRQDNYFRSLCMTKLTRLQNRILENYQRTNNMIRDLIADIETELGESVT